MKYIIRNFSNEIILKLNSTPVNSYSGIYLFSGKHIQTNQILTLILTDISPEKNVYQKFIIDSGDSQTFLLGQYVFNISDVTASTTIITTEYFTAQQSQTDNSIYFMQNSDIAGIYETTSTSTSIPAIPINLTAILLPSGVDIKLNWNEGSTNTNGFELWRKKWSGGTYIAINTDVQSYIYEDKFLEYQTNYYYKLRAFNDIGYSNFTNEVEVTTSTLTGNTGTTTIYITGSGETIVTNPNNNNFIVYSPVIPNLNIYELKTNFNNYTGQTAILINTKLNKTTFNSYTASTSGYVHKYFPQLTKGVCLNSSTGETTDLYFQRNNSDRWLMFTDTNPEVGGNVGSDLRLANYDDAGNYNDVVLQVHRNTGIWQFNHGINLGGTDVSVTGAEINQLSGVTSLIQTQLNSKQDILIAGSGIVISGDTISSTFSGSTGNYTPLNIYQTYTGQTAPNQFASKIHTHNQYLTGVTYSEITNKPNLGIYALESNLTGHTSDLTIHYKQSGISINESQVINLVHDLASKSGSGHTHSYTGSTITNKPDLTHFITGLSYNQLSGKPVLFTGNTFTASGGTRLRLVGNNLTIYSTTGGTGGGGSFASITGQPTDNANLTIALNAKSGTGHTHTSLYAPLGSYQSHTGDTTIHFTKASIQLTENQVTNLTNDLAGKLASGGTAVCATTAGNSLKLGNVLPAGYLLSGGTAVNSKALCGCVPASFLLSGGTAKNSTCLNGHTEGNLSVNNSACVNGHTEGNLSVNYAATAGAAPASDVCAWAKASVKPSYSAAEVGALAVAGCATDSGKLNNVVAAGYLLSGGTAINSNKLNNVVAAGYLLSGATAKCATTATNALCVNGHTEGNLSVNNSACINGHTEGNLSVANSACLGGVLPAAYLLSGGTAKNASCINGHTEAALSVCNSVCVNGHAEANLSVANSACLNGVLPAGYLLSGATAKNSTCLNGQLASFYLTTTACAADSAKLNNVLPAGYLLSGGTAKNSLCLGGALANTYLSTTGCACDSKCFNAKLPAYYLNTGSTIATATNALCLNTHTEGNLSVNNSVCVNGHLEANLVVATANNASCVNGHLEAALSVANSACLGGHLPAYYLLSGGTALCAGTAGNALSLGGALAACYQQKAGIVTYTGTTAIAAFASKSAAITGATNLGGSYTCIFTTVSANKINLKGLKGAGGLSISNDSNYITLSATTVTVSGATTDVFANVTDGFLMYRCGTAICGKSTATFLASGGTAVCATNSACLGGVLPSGYLTPATLAGVQEIIGCAGTSNGNGIRHGASRIVIVNRPTAPVVGLNAACSLSVTQVFEAGIIGYSASAARNLTLPTACGASGLVQALPCAAVGDVFQMTVYNTCTFAVSLVGGTNTTIVNTNTITCTNSPRLLNFRVTGIGANAETISVY